MFKLCIGSDLGISEKWRGFGIERSKVKVTGSIGAFHTKTALRRHSLSSVTSRPRLDRGICCLYPWWHLTDNSNTAWVRTLECLLVRCPFLLLRGEINDRPNSKLLEAQYYLMLIYSKTACDRAMSTGRPLDRSRVINGSERYVRAGVWFGAQAAWGSLGTVYEPVRLSLRSSHGPQTRTSSNGLEKFSTVILYY